MRLDRVRREDRTLAESGGQGIDEFARGLVRLDRPSPCLDPIA